MIIMTHYNRLLTPIVQLCFMDVQYMGHGHVWRHFVTLFRLLTTISISSYLYHVEFA